jgi:hypothetical protein
MNYVMNELVYLDAVLIGKRRLGWEGPLSGYAYVAASRQGPAIMQMVGHLPITVDSVFTWAPAFSPVPWIASLVITDDDEGDRHVVKFVSDAMYDEVKEAYERAVSMGVEYAELYESVNLPFVRRATWVDRSADQRILGNLLGQAYAVRMRELTWQRQLP